LRIISLEISVRKLVRLTAQIFLGSSLQRAFGVFSSVISPPVLQCLLPKVYYQPASKTPRLPTSQI
jgi:hypothetical protein